MVIEAAPYRCAAGEQSHRWPQWLPGGKAVLFGTLATEAKVVLEWFGELQRLSEAGAR